MIQNTEYTKGILLHDSVLGYHFLRVKTTIVINRVIISELCIEDRFGPSEEHHD